MRVQFGVQQNRAILLAESHKLNPRPLDEGPRSKSGKIETKPTWYLFWRENQLVQARVQGKVQLKDSICFKWVQMGPNWFM